MTDEIVSGLRMGVKLWEASADEMPRMTSHSRWLMNSAADKIERLSGALTEIASWTSDPIAKKTAQNAIAALTAGKSS